MLDGKFFRELAKDVVPMFRKHTFMDALDVKGRKFKAYSTEYGKAKRGDKIKRQSSEFKNSRAPVLTSDLLRDWKLRGTKANGFSFGTVAHGGKIKQLDKMGRRISTDSEPMPKHIIKFISKETDRYIKRKLKKDKGSKSTIIISK